MSLVFVSYSRKDSIWVDEQKHGDTALLPWLARKLSQSGVEVWWDKGLNDRVGEDYRNEIAGRINSATVVILLLSDDFFISKFISEFEMPLIRTLVREDKLRLFPIVVAHVDWGQNEHSRWLKDRHIHPDALKPLIEVVNLPAEWKKVRSMLAVALREQVERTTRSVPPGVGAIVSASPEVGGDKIGLTEPVKSSATMVWIAALVVLAVALGIGIWGLSTRNAAKAEIDLSTVTNELIRLTEENLPALNSLGGVGTELLNQATRLLEDAGRLGAQAKNNPNLDADALCSNAFQLHLLGHRLFHAAGQKDLGLQFLALSVANVTHSDGSAIECSDISWRVHTALAEAKSTLKIDENQVEALFNRALLSADKEFALRPQDLWRVPLQMRANTLLQKSVWYSSRAMADEATRLALEVDLICKTSTLRTGVLIKPMLQLDFDPSNMANVESVCSQASTKVRSRESRDPVDLIKTDVERVEFQSLLQKALGHLQKTREAATAGDWAAMMKHVLDGLGVVEEAQAIDRSSDALRNVLLDLLQADGYYSFFGASNAAHAGRRIEQAYLLANENLGGSHQRGSAVFQMARIYKLSDNPLIEEALAKLRADPDLMGGLWYGVHARLVLADHAALKEQLPDKARAYLTAARAMVDEAIESEGKSQASEALLVDIQNVTKQLGL